MSFAKWGGRSICSKSMTQSRGFWESLLGSGSDGRLLLPVNYTFKNHNFVFFKIWIINPV